MDIHQFKKYIDARIARFLKTKMQQSHGIARDLPVEAIIHHAQTIVASGGKRIRPYIAYLAYVSTGGEDIEEIAPACIALELIHTFALIHDDIIDRATQRHGVLTIEKFAEGHLKKEKRGGDVPAIARAHAIMIGDLVLNWAAEQYGVLPKNITSLFNTLLTEVIIGEMLDFDFTTRSVVSIKQILNRIVAKTARYTFAQPMLIGSAIAGEENNKKFWEQFGEALGLAFQIQDDLLDITSSVKVLGKPVLGDVREGQHTLFTQYIIDNGTVGQKKQLKSFLGKPVKKSDEQKVVQLFERAGALAWGQSEIDRYFAKARRQLAASNISLKPEWETIIALVENRKS